MLCSPTLHADHDQRHHRLQSLASLAAGLPLKAPMGTWSYPWHLLTLCTGQKCSGHGWAWCLLQIQYLQNLGWHASGRGCSGAFATPSASIMCAQVTSGAAVVFFGLLAAFRRRLPRMQFRAASGPACLTGLLWSIGNFLSIYAVQVH